MRVSASKKGSAAGMTNARMRGRENITAKGPKEGAAVNNTD